MKKLHTKLVYVLLFCLILTLTACSKKSEETKPAKDEFESVKTVINEVEATLLTVMGQIDLIPYYEKQIAAKKQKEEEQKQAQQSGGGGAQPPAGGEAKAPEGGQAPEKFEPEPLTVTDTLLTEVLKNEVPKEESERAAEKLKEMPDKIDIVWGEIITNINKLHSQWNELNPKLAEANVSDDSIESFNDALNSLTTSATDQKYKESLENSNKASAYIADFMKGSKNTALSPLYSMKYLIRQIILDSANEDYTKASADYQQLKEEADALYEKLAKKDADEEIAQLKSSINELNEAIAAKDVDLIKIEASVVSKNLSTIKDKIG